jgi:hypothetical protein
MSEPYAISKKCPKSASEFRPEPSLWRVASSAIPQAFFVFYLWIFSIAVRNILPALWLEIAQF